jgi:uncharacterized protein (UPF0335 family)
MTTRNETMLAIVEHIEALEAGRQAVAKQIADHYKAAHYHYKFDKHAIKAAVRHRADPARAERHRALVAQYVAALEQAKKECMARDLLRVHAHEEGGRRREEQGRAPPAQAAKISKPENQPGE